MIPGARPAAGRRFRRRSCLRALLGLVPVVLAGPAWAALELVAGSFVERAHAERRADRVRTLTAADVAIETARIEGRAHHRVRIRSPRPARVRSILADAGIDSWARNGPAQSGSPPAHTRDVPAAPEDDPAPTAPSSTSGPSARPVASAPSPATGSRPPPPAPLAWADDDGGRSEFHLDLGLQARHFLREGTLGQDRAQWSLSLQPEWQASWNGGDDRFTLAPFLRVDAMDRRRTHADLREAYWTRLGDGWELHLGLRRVFWGRAESLHLVDVINQVDLVENPDEEDRLGQPMAQLVLLRDAGAFELFLLPGARQRTFPSVDGRLAGPVRIDADARYTHPDGALHTGWAVRWSHALGDLEFGLAHFSGTAREPELEVTEPPVAGRPIRLRPVYELVSRSSLDAEYIVGDTALKLELLHRSGRGPRSTAFVAGFEHTFVGAFGTRTDLGILSEYLFDDRGDDAPFPPFDNDVFVGARLALNDPAGSRALAGVIRDHVTGETLFRLEASRRLGADWRLALEGLWFSGSDPVLPGDAAALSDPGARWGTVADDDYIQLELVRYF
jgi:hypothetical protein